MTPDRIAAIRGELDLPDHGVGLFVGGLDESKRLPFLFDAVAAIRRTLPSFVLVVAGDGPLRSAVEAASRDLPLRYVGRADDTTKAELAAVSQVMLMPGRVGLVALDALALGTPLVTTAWAYHAPEFEYLEHGRNAIVVEDSIDDYAAAVVGVVGDERLHAALRAAGEEDARRLTLEAMVRNFHDGVVAALNAPRRR